MVKITVYYMENIPNANADVHLLFSGRFVAHVTESKKERSIFWKMIASIILSKNIYMNMSYLILSQAKILHTKIQSIVHQLLDKNLSIYLSIYLICNMF